MDNFLNNDMEDLHYIQIEILKKLLFSPKLKYSELRPSDIENNKLNFHLKQLKDSKLVKKDGEYYLLTSKGKEFAGRIDTEKSSIQRQAKISAWVCCTRELDGELEFLIYTRLKHPFYGCQGFLSGKVPYGESVEDAARRELKEECGLSGDPILIQINHFLVKDINTRDLVEDKIMFLCLIKDPKGELIQSEEGKYEWVKEKDLKNYVTNHFESWEVFEEEIGFIKDFKGSLRFIESEHFSKKF